MQAQSIPLHKMTAYETNTGFYQYSTVAVLLGSLTRIQQSIFLNDAASECDLLLTIGCSYLQ